jgi:hypothetical protein
MIVNLVANPKAASSALVTYEQPAPQLVLKPVRTTIVLLVPGLEYVPPTPAEIAAAVWARAGRTLTA